MARFDLTDFEWLAIGPRLPDVRGKARVDDRRVLNGITRTPRAARSIVVIVDSDAIPKLRPSQQQLVITSVQGY